MKVTVVPVAFLMTVPLLATNNTEYVTETNCLQPIKVKKRVYFRRYGTLAGRVLVTLMLLLVEDVLTETAPISSSKQINTKMKNILCFIPVKNTVRIVMFMFPPK